MANYTAADIKALRESTGAGMLDVKRALDEADGDAKKATEIIRVKGLKGITKREGRSASDGLVAAHVADDPQGQSGVLIELNCETDFVTKNAKFIALAEAVLTAAVASGTDDVAVVLASDAGGRTVAATIDETAAVIGEKLVLRRVARVVAPRVTVYLHKVNKDLPPQVGVLVGTDEAGAPVAKDVAMHIAAYSPLYLTRDDVPADTVAAERRIAEETSRNEGALVARGLLGDPPLGSDGVRRDVIAGEVERGVCRDVHRHILGDRRTRLVGANEHADLRGKVLVDLVQICLLYTSDAADDLTRVD